MSEYKPKSFWKRPEGVTGIIVLGGLVIGGGILLTGIIPWLVAAAANTLSLAIMLLVLGAIIYLALDPKMRALVGYMYKSLMRWITGWFIQIDPIGVLKSYIDELRGNLNKMRKQVGMLRGQMHKLKELIYNNRKEIKDNLSQASKAKENNKQKVVILKSRKAGRLRESNLKYEDLYKKMEVLYRVLNKMYENSEIMLEDVEDQVKMKEQERIAIRASNSAMKSAMNIIRGNSDKRAMFDQALEAVADDVSNKIGEMEQFMDMSENFMKSVDLQNGVFEEEGMRMLEEWEKKSDSLILGTEKASLLMEAQDDGNVLDLNKRIERPERVATHRNQYDTFFE